MPSSSEIKSPKANGTSGAPCLLLCDVRIGRSSEGLYQSMDWQLRTAMEDQQVAQQKRQICNRYGFITIIVWWLTSCEMRGSVYAVTYEAEHFRNGPQALKRGYKRMKTRSVHPSLKYEVAILTKYDVLVMSK
ncbi:uncharacterized protein PITG_12657 [Phytophthora infestans T30-4]|uniref:Uncharacterized protein n=1 Tax=Phytophthora infestans (strain T30-4) TaxID=403677 RepID=D0NNF7_PHYIT|nr:uncharacterized protein PITG_12657 [Phytophthora infestans T30-4]EEY62093.1 hypothetical protein PITG_12657 [Phytophthora infestans T30-4]|eukprot:XP_002899397.1 hypothetical protein PITG_12657 [Phytophthora infestans T30-4]